MGWAIEQFVNADHAEEVDAWAYHNYIPAKAFDYDTSLGPRSIRDLEFYRASPMHRVIDVYTAPPAPTETPEGERIEGWVPVSGNPHETVPFFGHEAYTERIGTRPAVLTLKPTEEQG